MSFDSELREMVKAEIGRLPQPEKQGTGILSALVALLIVVVIVAICIVADYGVRLTKLELIVAGDRNFAHGVANLENLGPVVKIEPRAATEPLPGPEGEQP